MVPIIGSPHTDWCSWYWNVLCKLPEKKSDQQPTTKPHDLQCNPPNDERLQLWNKCCQGSDHHLIEFKAHLTRLNKRLALRMWPIT